jgi:hypothetical protein
MSWDEWRATPWSEQRALLDGLSEDESVPLSFEGGGEDISGGAGPIQRKADVGDGVIDITGMISDLEHHRRGRG